MGRNTKPIGGFAGLAEAMALANELQGDGTLHGHGFIALANAWQHSSLQDIADRIDQYVAKLNVDLTVFFGIRVKYVKGLSFLSSFFRSGVSKRGRVCV